MLDACELGGIYAGAITIKATEDGVGVNLPKISTATAHISSSGKLTLKTLDANQSTITAKDMTLLGATNVKELTLSSSGKLTLKSTLKSDNANISANDLSNEGVTSLQTANLRVSNIMALLKTI